MAFKHKVEEEKRFVQVLSQKIDKMDPGRAQALQPMTSLDSVAGFPRMTRALNRAALAHIIEG